MIIVLSGIVLSQKTTVGLIQHLDGSLDEGCILFSPNYSNTTFLIDKCGYVINKWVCKYRPGFAAYLLPDGSLVRSGYLQNKQFTVGGSGGIIEKLDWDGNLLWSYELSNDNECMHHDIKPMPNGNILVICWDSKSESESIAMGRKSTIIDSCVWSEKIIELKPIGKDSTEIVWEWKVWDHLVQNIEQAKPNFGEISKHPELININYLSYMHLRDWLHINSVSYNEKYDQILLSTHNFGEIWIIDHSTTKAEAAGHSGGKYGKGGDLLYRWGNPLAYENGIAADQKFFYQHSADWIPEGYPNENCISVFNNDRVNNGTRFSSIDVFKPTVNNDGFYESQVPFGPDDLKWSYSAKNPQEFYSSILGSVQQLSNGNLLICDGGAGNIFEIDSASNEVWRYVNPITVMGVTMQGKSTMALNPMFNCVYYPHNYSAFVGKELSRIGIIENINTNSENCSLDTTSVKDYQINVSVYPNPASDYIKVDSDVIPNELAILSLQGQELIIQNFTNTISTKDLPNGIYIMRITNPNGHNTYNKIIITR